MIYLEEFGLKKKCSCCFFLLLFYITVNGQTVLIRRLNQIEHNKSKSPASFLSSAEAPLNQPNYSLSS